MHVDPTIAASDFLIRENRRTLRFKGRSQKHWRRLLELKGRTKHQLRQIEKELS